MPKIIATSTSDGIEVVSKTIVDGGGAYNIVSTIDENDKQHIYITDAEGVIESHDKELIEGTVSQYFDARGNISSIGSYAFYSQESLEKVSFLSCSYIGNRAFAYCSSLTNISFPACTNIGSNAFLSCISLMSASFPICTEMGSYAFGNCTSLSNVSFPICTNIGIYAFAYCSSLSNVSFPACTDIGNYAFAYCSSLSNVSFPECTNIKSYAFRECSSLESVYLTGSNVVMIGGSNVFYSTPIIDSSYLGYYGSVYVPSSLVTDYKSASNWSFIADRIVGV